MFVPKSLDRAVKDAGHMLFSNTWLDAPDDSPLPTSSTPNVEMPESGAYMRFQTNYERFAAQELTKRLDTVGFTKKGFMMQAIAAGWHRKTAAQLGEMAERVGRERISVMHGTADNMISVPHGRKLIEMIEPGKGEIREGTGHVFMLEEWRWHNEFVEGMFEKGERLNRA